MKTINSFSFTRSLALRLALMSAIFFSAAASSATIADTATTHDTPKHSVSMISTVNDGDVKEKVSFLQAAGTRRELSNGSVTIAADNGKIATISPWNREAVIMRSNGKQLDLYQWLRQLPKQNGNKVRRDGDAEDVYELDGELPSFPGTKAKITYWLSRADQTVSKVDFAPSPIAVSNGMPRLISWRNIQYDPKIESDNFDIEKAIPKGFAVRDITGQSAAPLPK